jgi:hypothetical protein
MGFGIGADRNLERMQLAQAFDQFGGAGIALRMRLEPARPHWADRRATRRYGARLPPNRHWRPRQSRRGWHRHRSGARRRGCGFLGDTRDRVVRAFARRSARAIGHRDETGAERSERDDRSHNCSSIFSVLGGKNSKLISASPGSPAKSELASARRDSAVWSSEISCNIPKNGGLNWGFAGCLAALAEPDLYRKLAACERFGASGNQPRCGKGPRDALVGSRGAHGRARCAILQDRATQSRRPSTGRQGTSTRAASAIARSGCWA